VLPNDLTIGPDGNLWIDTNNSIAVMTQSGQGVASYPLPHQYANAWGITTGVDGNLWFGEYNAPYLASITTSGKITEYRTPESEPAVMSVTNGPDGNIWFGEFGGGTAADGTVGYIDPNTKKITTVQLNLYSHVRQVFFDSHNNLWFSGVDQGDSMVGDVVY
jgi:streptogramin lyase